MSKLKIVLLGGLVCIGLGYAFFFGPHTFLGKFAAHQEQHAHDDTTDDPSEIWGKANAPILVKITELEHTDTTVVLEGRIRSQFPELQVEWKLPEGAELLDGESRTSAQKSADGNYDVYTVTIDITSVTNDEPIVFTAYVEKDGERISNTRIYKITKSPEDQERVEEIRQMMKKSGSKLVR